MYYCGLKNKYADLWSHHNYIVYVAEGRKIWHTSNGSYDLQAGSCVFVRKGAAIVEQFFDTEFCFYVFFITDEFIADVLKSKSMPIFQSCHEYAPVIRINNSSNVQSFFGSMGSYFNADRQTDPSLLEIKFRELILIIADNPSNSELLSCFHSLLQEPHSQNLQRVMEENFCFNLSMHDFARLSARSLSSFKRDFRRLYNIPPGKWLLEKRLNHAYHLLTNLSKNVSDTAFESGFESPSHFSRAFKKHFGISPVSAKQKMAV